MTTVPTAAAAMSRRFSAATERTPLLKPPSGKLGSSSELAVPASRRPPRPESRSERSIASDAEGRQPPGRRQPRRKLVSESDVPRPGGARIAPRGGATTGSESESERSRRPYHYHQVPGTHRFRHDSGAEASDCEVATFSRFNYISKVMGGSSGRLARRGSETGSEGESESVTWEPPHFTIPDHLIPAEFFIPYTPFVHAPRPGEESKNSSLITVFAIWNTMMGTSILSMPWLIEQSGLISSVVTFIVMGVVCTFTAFRVLTMQKRLRIPPPTHDFQNIMRDVLSKHWEYFGILFSVAVLMGAMLVYWVLMTNFLYKSVDYFYDLAIGNFSKYDINTTVVHGAYCPENVLVPTAVDVPDAAAAPESFYDKIWNAQTTPLFLIVLLFPLLNIKSPTFFTKFTGLGTISVLYMIVFVTTKAVQFGINVSFSDDTAFDYVQLFRPNFPVAMGTLSLAMFIHNCICRIMESNEHQEHNVRDLFIAYFLVFITYLYIGLLFFLAWPFAKTCIQDNFLDNFLGTDPMSIVARLFLFFQMCTVFPLLGFMIRAQLMTFLFGTTYPGPGRVLLLNTGVVMACVAVAIFYPHIGQLLRFSGAFCGMAWIFTFPCVTYLVGAHRRGQLRWPGALLHSALIVLGVINLVLQFVVKTD